MIMKPYNNRTYCLAIALSSCAISILARPQYADLIPNGRSVPNPGSQGGVWAGVGHENAAGGGPRNPFGLDFMRNNFEWTTELCMKDSDGDGRTNGQELGDPDCVWTEGDEPALPASSHPGIVDTPITTDPRSDSCKDFVESDDMQLLDMSFSIRNEMNASRTHYRCEQLEVSSPNPLMSWEQIKTQVILDNSNVLHHIWIYHCINGDSSDGNRVGQGPYECNGMEANCQIIAGWAVGPEEYCEPPNVGAFIDFQQKVFKIEAHYDNSQGTDQTDQSGMRLSLTSTPRPLSAGLSVLGMDYWDRQFLVPGGQAVTSLSNLCPTSMTKLLPRPVFVYSWNPHMHLYGKKLVTEHYRCGTKIGEIGRIEDFEFDNQQSYRLDPPVKILPGDALVTKCTYDTSDIANDVPGGESTTEEMCDNYLTFYPWVGENEPNLFTACATFEIGLNPKFAGYDDSSSFATFDLGGDIFVSDWERDPTKNVADCCATNTCETDFVASVGEPCAVNADCVSDLVCSLGLCITDTNGGQTTAPQSPPTNAPILASASPQSPPTNTPTSARTAPETPTTNAPNSASCFGESLPWWLVAAEFFLYLI